MYIIKKFWKKKTKMKKWRTHLTPADDVSIHSKHIDDLAFTLIAPLRSKNNSNFGCSIWHTLFLPWWCENAVSICLLNGTLHFRMWKYWQFFEQLHKLPAHVYTSKTTARLLKHRLDWLKFFRRMKRHLEGKTKNDRKLNKFM